MTPLTPPRRRLLLALRAVAAMAESDGLPAAAYLIATVIDAVEDGTEAELSAALAWLAAREAGTALDVAELVGDGAGDDGASVSGPP